MTTKAVPPTRTLEERSADLGAGRCIRVRLIRSASGEPEELYLAEGWHDGGNDARRSLGPLPGHALAELHEALGSLLEAGE